MANQERQVNLEHVIEDRALISEEDLTALTMLDADTRLARDQAASMALRAAAERTAKEEQAVHADGDWHANPEGH